MSVSLPSDRSSEIGVIGACLDGGIESCIIAFDLVPDKAFFNEDLRMVFQCLNSVVNRGTAPDVISLASEWKRLGFQSDFPFSDIAMAQDRSASFLLEERAATVLELFHRRSAIMAADALLYSASDMGKPLADSISMFESELVDSRPKTPPIHEPRASAELLINNLERRHQLQGKRSGIKSGINSLDNITDGLQLGEFWVIGARPGAGKTTLSLNIAESVAFVEGIPCLFVSLEMSAEALLLRMLSMHTRINARDVRRGLFNAGDFKSMTVFTAKLSRTPFYIMDAPGGAKDSVICNSIRAAIRRWGVKVVILDYIQKIKPESKGEKRTYEIGDTTGKLVELTKREKINLFALAQLNRDKDKQARAPMVSDLADSKAIEADADFIGLLDRPVRDSNGDLDESRALLHVAKQRDGERGTIELSFDGSHHRFSEFQK